MAGLMDGLLPHQLHGGGSFGRDWLRVWCPVAHALEFASLRRSYWPRSGSVVQRPLTPDPEALSSLTLVCA